MNGSNSPRSPTVPSKNAASGSTRKCFGPEGCPAIASGRRCGETKNLQIIQEFRKLYEDKMQQIDDAAGGDCVQAKINLQQEWIRDLTDQNEMLVRVVEELEVEAAERVTMLEDKLQQSAKCACEVMDSYKDFSINILPDLQKMERIQNDLNNVIEIVRRARNGGVWSSKGLRFYTVDIERLMHDKSNHNGDVGVALIPRKGVDKARNCDCSWIGDAPKKCKNEKFIKEKDKKIKELEDKIKRLIEANDVNGDTNKTCQELKKSMLEMRDALTAEVAEKHDAILCLRREVHLLEDQCRKAEQQTHFKDDIIKELRKEIKQLKLQRTKKSRSPRTLKRCEHHRLIHPSRTDPDTNIRNIRDGTIVIKDSATVGDDIATQVIKEKYSDPCNQTVVYICETVSQRRKSNSRDGSKIVETSPGQNRSFGGDSRSCEVSLDNSRRKHVVAGDCLENSRDLQVDYPRNTVAEGDVSRDSENLMPQKNYFVYPSIHETCIRYSRDILEMLNNHSIEDKKGLNLNEFLTCNPEEKDIPTMLNITGEESVVNVTNDKVSDEKIKEPGDVELGEVEVTKEKLPEQEDSSGFLSNTLSKCERYFLDMYRNKCKVRNELSTSCDEAYLKRFRDCFDGKRIDEDNSFKIKQYEISKRIKDLKQEALNLITMGDSLGTNPEIKERIVNCRSNFSQTTGFGQVDQKTQTSDGDLLSYVVTCDQSNEAPQASIKENGVLEQSVYPHNDVSHDNSYENRHQNEIPQMEFNKMNTSAETENISTEEVWNNLSNFKSGDVSFEEAEMAAYSTPFYEEIPQYYQPEIFVPRQIDKPPMKYEEFEVDEPKFFRINPENRRLCGIPRKVPVVPVRQYVLQPPHMRHAKMLSPRTLRKVPMPQIHRAEVPLSVRSRSLPTCAGVYASSHELQKPMRLHKVHKKVPNCPEQFVDMGFVVEDRNFVKRVVPNGYVGLTPRDKVNCGGRRLTREECFDCWPRMNNTY
ncbi:hypothetical protein Trydic_g7841 [Trypoxylus dichotomus]